ncbi:acetyl-coenzyme A carboxylase carboxyl transferase subunit alpha, chloroplastic-like [Asparagus officinalis]|uniref:acetyl-coenzyme A carboxylase carboxyl transferase subunit alpha, chloroplastic-like n=1 Tax=Asparagus officinalis TaxID=4686 RepID=UPI00098E4DD5|nr:acetyl-coenzyme A carboxylase carboxyl transferase subunit alpha, chloroplastic-like [Asparagus officinalis]XP_020271713.1 acetyl-coenzyme A carboxylase carboxyl transferase subunit alpha, chloroplastic-like [Asparagus officinalis]
MNSLILTAAISGGESCSFVLGSHINLRKEVFGAELPRSPFRGIRGDWLKSLKRSGGGSGYRLNVTARIKKAQKHEYPWPDNIDPNIESGHLSYLSHFKPLKEKPKPVTLPFEKPLLDLEKKIIDVRKMANETGLDFTDQINLLESKYQEALKELYTHLTPIQRLTIARHPNRPTFLDHILNITDKWVELHGDRAGYDDPAIVTGIGSIDGKTYMFIGHQKGRNTKENIQRNFGMPTPHGYRKALRMMRYADHHGFPIITFIDTPGAFADLKSEELGQGEAIAYNLRAMFGLKVPIVTVVIGEGGSGGALAIGCANKLFMMDNSVFYVASPEACAAILWKSSQAAPKAAEKLKITANELCRLKIADGIIPEPLGGAHTDPAWTSQQIKLTVTKAMEELCEMDTDSLLNHRHLKFRNLGGFLEGSPIEPEKKRNMKKKEADISQATADIEVEIEKLKKAALEGKSQSPGPVISNEAVEKLKQDLDKEMTNAFISMGLQEKLESLKMELSKSPSNSPDQSLSPALKEKADRLMQEFKHNLSRPGSYLGLKQKLQMLSEVNKLGEHKIKAERLKSEINQKLHEQVKGKTEILKMARDRVAKGEKLNEDEIKEVNMIQEELKEMLKSLNLEVVGLRKKILPTKPPVLEEKLTKADEVIKMEIAKAIDAAGLNSKIDELKTEIANGASKETVEKLINEIREGIIANLDSAQLKEKVASTLELPLQETVGAGNQ